jgi:autotransporter translocation and assembly factor TamB
VKGLELDLLGRTSPVTGILALQADAEGRGLMAAGLMAQANFRVILLRRDRRSGVVGRADGLIKAAKGLVSLERLRVDLPPNRLTMKGSLWKEFNLQVAARFPRVDQVGKLLGAEGLGGKGKVKGRLMGTLAAPVFRGALTWDAARLLGTDFKTIRGNVELQQRRMIARPRDR